jgi:hypothetical protein
MKRPLMGTDNILELQDNGYKSSVSALSELVDNSIQAGATKVDIIIVRNTLRLTDEIDEVLVIDNGIGMDEKIFDKALQMSAGSRTRAKSGLGKYGQGLPNSSISQTKRVEVYTYQNRRDFLFNYIDLDEIHDSQEPYLPNIEKVSKISIPLIESKKYVIDGSGTIVRWVKPNKIKPKTAKTLVNHIEQVAGRTFRYFIHGYKDIDGGNYKCDLNILVFDYNGANYEMDSFNSRKKIKPFDPMFLMQDSQMNALFPKSEHPTSLLYNENIKKKFKVDYGNETIETEVELRLSYCKKEERARYGRNAGSDDFGKKYLYRNLIGTSGYNNISIIRAGREIDYGSFGFITDVSDPTERWWSAEVIVQPVIDSIIGIDNKKQQAANLHFIETSENTTSDNHEILHWISTYLRTNITEVKKLIDKQNSGADTDKKKDKKDVKTLPGSETEPGDPAKDKDPDDDEKRIIMQEFSKWIKERYNELQPNEIKEIVDHALSIRDNHIFVKSDLGESQLFSYKVFGTKVLIEVNYSHSFYKRFIQQFEDSPGQEKSLRSIRLLIGAMVNSEIVNATQDQSLLRDRRNIKTRMAEKLNDYIDDLFKS